MLRWKDQRMTHMQFSSLEHFVRKMGADIIAFAALDAAAWIGIHMSLELDRKEECHFRVCSESEMQS